MKVLNIILAFLFFAVFFNACHQGPGSAERSGAKATEEVVQDLKHAKAEIKGMTCEIGCARLIQSKLYKTEGVTFASVSFADSSGVISYDASRVSIEDLKAVIEGAGGGDLYTVASIHGIPEASIAEPSSE